MIGVLPGIVDIVSVNRGDGEPVRRLQHLEGGRLQLSVTWVTLQHLGRAFVRGLYPSHRTFARNIFEPLIFIARLRGSLSTDVYWNHGHGSYHREECCV